MAPCDIFIFAGEKSGDLHGGKLVSSLLHTHPHLNIEGVGGPEMRAAGLTCILPMEDFQVMGFIDVFLALPKLIRQFYAIRNAILEKQPKVVVFIDYPGFNLRMASALRKKNYKGKLCHFICPSVWAWGKKRIPLMAKSLDLLLTILPFEKKYFSETSLKVDFVGHPLIQKIASYPYQTLAFPKGRRIIGIFPGSREKELRRNFPEHLKVAKQLLKDDPSCFFVVSVSEPRFHAQLTQMIHLEGLNLSQDIMLLPTEQTYDLMQSAEMAIAKSGTVTLELALHEVPTVVTYGISPLDLFIARDLLRIRLPFYCLVNIIGEKEIFPELFGPNLTVSTLYKKAKEFLFDKDKQQQCRRLCKELRLSMGSTDASEEAARLIAQLSGKNDQSVS